MKKLHASIRLRLNQLDFAFLYATLAQKQQNPLEVFSSFQQLESVVVAAASVESKSRHLGTGFVPGVHGEPGTKHRERFGVAQCQVVVIDDARSASDGWWR